MEELGQASERWNIAYEALARVGTPAIEPLIDAIQSENDLLRHRSISLLGEIGDERALAPLESASTIEEQDFRRIAQLPGRTRTINCGGMRIEVSVADELQEYRRDASNALKRITEKCTLQN
jgi:HEAT repeat protein